MTKLIKLSETHYIVVDDSEIKENEYFIDMRNHPDLDSEDIYRAGLGGNVEHSNQIGKKITHSTEPLQGVKSISISDVRKVVNDFIAQERLAKNKLFTLEELEWAFLRGALLNQRSHNGENIEFTEERSNDIQRIIKTEWPVEFVDGKIKLMQ